MAYDIYGNNLRPGYCEVHPRIHERYPCSLCIVEEELQKAREVIKQLDRKVRSMEDWGKGNKKHNPSPNVNPYDLGSMARAFRDRRPL